MNWARPAAPTGEVAPGFQLLSASSWAARTDAGIPATLAAFETSGPHPLGTSFSLKLAPLTLTHAAACAGEALPPTEIRATPTRPMTIRNGSARSSKTLRIGRFSLIAGLDRRLSLYECREIRAFCRQLKTGPGGFIVFLVLHAVFEGQALREGLHRGPQRTAEPFGEFEAGLLGLGPVGRFMRHH